MDLIHAYAYIATMCAVLAGWAWLNEKSRRKSIQLTIKSHCGGILDRIDVIRQTAETVECLAPDLFFKQPELLSWLLSTDEFLCYLRDRSGLSEDQEWRGAPRPRNRGIYVRIQHLIKPATRVA